MAVDRNCQVCGKAFRVHGVRAKTAGRCCSMKCKGIASRITANCESCGKYFRSVGRGKSARAKFCSKACFGASRAFRRWVPCLVCQTGLALEPRIYCSTACHDVHQSRNKQSFVCKTCGGDFKWSPSRTKNQNPTYCSIACRTACPDWRRNVVIAGNVIQSRRATPSKLEVAGERILRDLGVKFSTQVLIDDRFLVDAYIPSANLVVQWDGGYWHGYRAPGDERPLDNRQRKRCNLDRSQDAYMTKHGYVVLRFWEHEVQRNPAAVQADIARRRRQDEEQS